LKQSHQGAFSTTSHTRDDLDDFLVSQGFESLYISFAFYGFHLSALLFIALQKYDFFGMKSKDFGFLVFFWNLFLLFVLQIFGLGLPCQKYKNILNDIVLLHS
jgi:hypothetical protein